MILSIPTTFGLFCTEPQIINADLRFQHFKLLRFTNKIEFLFLFSLVFNMLIIHFVHCTFYVSWLFQKFNNSTQILLIFESMQHCRNDQEQEKLLTHFCCWWWCFHASIFLALMLAPRDAWCFVVSQGDHIKYIFFIACIKVTLHKQNFVKSNAKSIWKYNLGFDRLLTTFGWSKLPG